MSIKVVLFDLDGTLLPMDQNVFVKDYFSRIAAHLAPYGYDPYAIPELIWKGTAAMVMNDGKRTNEDAFWDTFSSLVGFDARRDSEHFDAFYREKFDAVRASCGFDPMAKEAVFRIKSLGYRVALATNPIFPSMATQSRIRWAGLSPEDFELYTTYENSSFCKPSLDYYRAITEQLGMSAEECLMVGNDVGEDMVAARLGMKVFLVTPCLINKKNGDISVYPSGDLSALLRYVESL